MSYFRPVREEELISWLLENGLAEEESGFGHVSAEELAQKLIDRFDVLTLSKSP